MSRFEELESHAAALNYDNAVQNNKFNLVSKLGLYPRKDGDMWCFLWGENLQDGVVGFGKTVARAAEDFEENCYRSIKQ